MNSPTTLDLLPAPFSWIDIPGKGYSIGKYPITNAQFAKFIEADGYHNRQWWTDAGWKAREEGWHFVNINTGWKPSGSAWTEPRNWNQTHFNDVEQPVVSVSWYESVAFCRWLSEVTDQTIQLPTDDQWRYAAQGDDNRIYPWGNAWDSKRCNNHVPKLGSTGTTPVRTYEGLGDSPFGVVDMAGNVFEWCLTDYDAMTNDEDGAAEFRVMRGGAWKYDNPADFRCDQRFRFVPQRYDDGIGFRICRS